MGSVNRPVVVQAWEESEAGWGVRPDGLSLHPSEADRRSYIEAYWERMPRVAPGEYERPCGSPRVVDLPDDIEVPSPGRRVYRHHDDYSVIRGLLQASPER